MPLKTSQLLIDIIPLQEITLHHPFTLGWLPAADRNGWKNICNDCHGSMFAYICVCSPSACFAHHWMLLKILKWEVLRCYSWNKCTQPKPFWFWKCHTIVTAWHACLDASYTVEMRLTTATLQRHNRSPVQLNILWRMRHLVLLGWHLNF